MSENESNRGRGLRPVPSHKQHLLGAAPRVAVASSFSASLAIDHRGHLHPLRVNQGRSASCPGGGTCQLIYAALSLAGTPLPWLPSPRGIYADVRCIEQPGDGPLEDSGADPADIVTALATMGIRRMTPETTPDMRPYDLWGPDDLRGVANAPPPNLGLRPTLEEDAESRREIVVGLETLNSTAADFEDQIVTVLQSGAVVGIGLDATNAYEAHGEQHHDDAMPALDDASGATPTDGHWTGIYAVRPGPKGREFLDLSSWGGAWGVNGGIWLTSDWLRQRTIASIAVRARLKVSA